MGLFTVIVLSPLCCLFALMMLLLSCIITNSYALAADGLAVQDIQRINTAVAVIRQYALMPPKSSKLMTDDILRAYAHYFDQYGDFLSDDEYKAFVESNTSDYFGVEMDMVARDHRIYLYPFRAGEAEYRGICSGDELMAVDGNPVYGKSLFLVGMLIRGALNKHVYLTVRTGKGVPRIISLKRQRSHYISVEHISFQVAEYIDIRRFVRNSDSLLKGILKKITDRNKAIVIDLRGNQGGILGVAAKCADFFLPKGKPMYHLKGRDSTKDILSEDTPLVFNPIIILQDRVTASASEVFIAALTENSRALSAGEKSFGKGLAQRFFPVPGGGALRLTFAEIFTPNMKAYNRRGLMPSRVLPPSLLEQKLNNEKAMIVLLKAIGNLL